MLKNKKPLVRIGVIFVGLLLFLTFFSNTIFNFNLTNVVLGFPGEGVLTIRADGTGIVEFAETDRYLSQADGRITFFVAEGDMVSAGSPLFTIEADIGSLRQALDDHLLNEERILLRTEKAGDSLERAQAELEAVLPEAQRRSIEAAISDIQFQIQELELDLRASRITAERLRDQIADMEDMTVTSERDGRVLGIAADSGTFVNTNTVVIEKGARDAGFITVVELPETVDFINVGDVVTLNMRARNIFGIMGEISRLTYENGQMRTEIRFNDENLTGGERLELSTQYISQLHETLIPNRALRSDSSGDYVLIVEMVSGTLRDEFYARRVVVRPLARDNRHTSIIMIVHEMSPIIIDSDRVVSAGDRIRIVGGSDLVGR